MKLFNWLFGNGNAASAQETLPEPPTADQSTADTPKDEVFVITYGTRMPIDAIYAFIEKDYETAGYDDALINPSAEYCTAKENIILHSLNHLFERVLLVYKDELLQLNVKVENAKALFALTSVTALEARMTICEQHIAEITKMKEKVRAKDPDMMIMIDSYRRGFTRGHAAQLTNFMNTRNKQVS